MIGPLCRDDSRAFAPHVKAIDSQVRQQFFFSVGPQNFRTIETRMISQPEMDAKIVLREIASSTNHFSKLYQVARGGAYPCIQRQPLEPCS
jgi:hypothetical protein